MADRSGVGVTINDYRDPVVIARTLREASVWAVVGLGDDETRPAYDIANFLQSRGKRIVPIHPKADVVLGEPVYRTLADVPFAVDVVDIFRRSDHAGRFVDQAIKIGAPTVWLQLGVIDLDAANRAAAAGLDVIMDACPKIEWRRFGSSTP